MSWVVLQIYSTYPMHCILGKQRGGPVSLARKRHILPPQTATLLSGRRSDVGKLLQRSRDGLGNMVWNWRTGI
jgi:hypothetical protein